MIYRPARKCRVWWDTKFSRTWVITGLIAKMWGKLFAYIPPNIPDNDRDHCWKW